MREYVGRRVQVSGTMRQVVYGTHTISQYGTVTQYGTCTVSHTGLRTQCVSVIVRH